MKISRVLIFSVNFIYSLALFVVPENDVIKNYTLASTKVASKSMKKFPKKGFFNIQIVNHMYTVFVNPITKSDLCNENTEVLLYNGNTTLKTKFSDYPTVLVNGYFADYEDSSGVSGYVSDGEFYGTLYLKNKTYYAENINRFPEIAKLNENNSNFNAIIYNEDMLTLLGDDLDNLGKRYHRSNPNFSNEEKIDPKIIYKNFIKDKHICSLLLLLDNSFLKIIHHNDVTAAIAQVMLSVNEVNSVFRSTDFDGDDVPDNLGFLIKYLVILESEDSPFNYLPPHSKAPVSPRYYLAHFTQYLILKEVCLGVLFTAQSFQENVLGVSYSAVSEVNITNEIIGGICQRPFTSYMLSLNAIAVSYVSMHGAHLSQATLDTCLTHELGHAFGCRHDRKSDRGYHQDYLMSSHTLPGTSVKNYQFSPTSKKHLVATVPRKGHCLMKSTESFCGNGILEKGEECDCGAKYICQLTDPCCIPNSMNGGCQINRADGYECHPSQGLCCSLHCKYENFEKVGVDCSMMRNTCPCKNENEGCLCGIGGRCLGLECQSEECARIDAEECECPSSLNGESCNICCLANPEGSCLPSAHLTGWKINMGLITVQQLVTFNARRLLPNLTDYKKFCRGIECVTLAFKKSKVGDFCVTRGKMGMCTKMGCTVEPRKRFQTERLARMNSKSVSVEMFHQILFLYCTLLLLLIHILYRQ